MGLKPGDPGYIDEDVSPMLYSITFTCLGVGLLIVILRLFSHLYLLKGLRLNLAAWLIVLSSLLDIASCILVHYQIKTGMGRHVEYSRARPAMFQMSMKFGMAQNAVYQALVGLIKASVLAQLYILAHPGKQQKVVMWTGSLVVVFTIFTTLSAIFYCIPMNAAWNLKTFPKGCWNMLAVNFTTSTINTIFDFVIFFLPLPTLLSLRMERKKKMSLLFTYCAGSLAIACSIVRLRNMIYFNGIGDFTFEASMVPVWGVIECNAGIVCASFPFIMPVIRRVSSGVIDTITGTRTRSHSSHAHELQRSERSWKLNYQKRQPQWRGMDSESIEQITNNNGCEDSKNTIRVTHHIEQVEHNVPAHPRDATAPREAI